MKTARSEPVWGYYLQNITLLKYMLRLEMWKLRTTLTKRKNVLNSWAFDGYSVFADDSFPQVELKHETVVSLNKEYGRHISNL